MFDPYHKWLGIPREEQPPNHYRLLGLSLFEADHDVIDAAANRQMAYLQGCATGTQALLSQRLLNEVAAARLCLLNPEKKATYDARLRAKRSIAPKEDVRDRVRPRGAFDDIFADGEEPDRSLKSKVLMDADEAAELLATASGYRPGLEQLRRTNKGSGRVKSRRSLLFVSLLGALALAMMGGYLASRLPRHGEAILREGVRDPRNDKAGIVPTEDVPGKGQGRDIRSTTTTATVESNAVVEKKFDSMTTTATVDSKAMEGKKTDDQRTKEKDHEGRVSVDNPPDQRRSIAEPSTEMVSLESSKEKPKSWINLMPFVDPLRDSAGVNKWFWDNGCLASPDGLSLFNINYRLPAEYKMRVTVIKGSKQMLGVGLITGKTDFLIAFDIYSHQGFASVFDWVDGKTITFRQGRRVLPLLEESTVIFTVRMDSVAVESNGREIGKWSGDFRRLSVNSFWSFGRKNLPFICSVGQGTKIRLIEMMQLSDQEPKIPDPPKQVPPPGMVVAHGPVQSYPENRFTRLFNGRNLDDWVGYANAWRVDPQRGVLISPGEDAYVYGAGKGDRFDDFVLRFSYRVLSTTKDRRSGLVLRHTGESVFLVIGNGDSGDLIFTKLIEDPGKRLRQENLANEPGGDRFIVKKNVPGEKALGDWNTCEVVCDGPSVTVTINGQIVNHVPNAIRSSGSIAFTQNGTKAEYRDIRIMSIRSAAPSQPKSIGRPR